MELTPLTIAMLEKDAGRGTTDLHGLQDGDSLEHLTGRVGGGAPAVTVTFQSSRLGNVNDINNASNENHNTGMGHKQASGNMKVL